MTDACSVLDAELEELLKRWHTRSNRHDDYRGINSCRKDLTELLEASRAKRAAAAAVKEPVKAATLKPVKQETK